MSNKLWCTVQEVLFVIVQFTVGWREMEAGRRPCRDPVSGSHPRIRYDSEGSCNPAHSEEVELLTDMFCTRNLVILLFYLIMSSQTCLTCSVFTKWVATITFKSTQCSIISLHANHCGTRSSTPDHSCLHYSTPNLSSLRLASYPHSFSYQPEAT